MRRGFRDDEAVSNVMGGVLFFTIVFLFFVTIQVDFVPQWTEDDEAALATQVQGQMSQLKGEADRQAGNQSVSAVGNPVTLGERQASKFFQSNNPPGSISFEPGVASVTMRSDELLVFEQRGQTSFAANETWTSLPGPVTLNDVSDVRHLRIRIEDPGAGDAGDNIKLSVYDGDGDLAGRLTVYLERDPPNDFIFTRVESPSEVIYDQGSFFHLTGTVNRWWVDALEPALHFHDLLVAAEGPLTLVFEKDGFEGAYTITYVQQTAGGGTLVGNAGRTITDFEQSYAAGRLSVTLPAQRFMSQSYHMENGGVILEQDDGTVMRVAPVFQVETLGSLTKLTITTPALVGGADALTTRGTVNVLTDGRGGNHLVGTAPHLTYSVQTAFPEAWETHLDRVLSNAGLDAAAGEYVITSNAGSVTVTVYGKSADPASTDHDLAVNLTHARVHIDFGT